MGTGTLEVENALLPHHREVENSNPGGGHADGHAADKALV
jgi:hypothetical protein